MPALEAMSNPSPTRKYSVASGLLSGMRIVEGAAFVAGPLGGMTLAQLGADVIRFDPIGGGLDHRRWPITGDGRSLYWAGLNKGKRSVVLDLKSEEGRELATSLITAPGPDAGIFLTNYPVGAWLDYDHLAELRGDLIMCHILGNNDGSTAVDYTVNAAVGFPEITGPDDFGGVMNSVVPTWDLVTGMTAATGILAADRFRQRTGEGRLMRLSLSDVAVAVLGHLGQIAEVQVNDDDRGRYGNYLYGAFGRDFVTADDRRVMVVAITPRQFKGLIAAAGLQSQLEVVEKTLGFKLRSDGELFNARETIAGILEPWFASQSLAEVATAFAAHRVLWGPYQTVRQMLENDPRATAANAMLEVIEQPGIGQYLMPGSPLDTGQDRLPPRPAPLLGEHTDEVLSEILDLSPGEIGRLHDRKVVAGAEPV